MEQLPRCGHFFHSSCIRRWLDRTSSCPICRRILRVPGEGLSPGAAVCIVGLVSQTHLNDSSGTCMEWNTDKGCWLVRLSSNDEKFFKPHNLEVTKRLSIGASVRAVGLVSAAHLNGTNGICLGWIQETGRWLVRLNGGEQKALRPDNLEVEQPGNSDTMAQVLGVMENASSMRQFTELTQEILSNPHGAAQVVPLVQEFMRNPEMRRYMQQLALGPDISEEMAAMDRVANDPSEIQRMLTASYASLHEVSNDPNAHALVRDFMSSPEVQQVLQEIMTRSLGPM